MWQLRCIYFDEYSLTSPSSSAFPNGEYNINTEFPRCIPESSKVLGRQGKGNHNEDEIFKK